MAWCPNMVTLRNVCMSNQTKVVFDVWGIALRTDVHVEHICVQNMYELMA